MIGFADFVKNAGLRFANVDFAGYIAGKFNDRPEFWVKNLEEANAVSSLIRSNEFSIFDQESKKSIDWKQLHLPVLDIDMPCVLTPSTTPGHHHLLIRKAMPWSDYVKLLDVLAEVGILEEGFVGAAKRRGQTWVRTPWTQKRPDDATGDE